MTYFTSELLNDGLYRIADIAGTKQYLVVGSESAVLIDCGVGAGNIYEYVRTLTEKPLSVIITHGHVDHAMGSGTFPADVPVYMSCQDRSVYTAHSDLSMRRSFAAAAQPELQSGGEWPSVRPFTQLLDLAPGDRFDVGGEEVCICPGMGHTRGCITVLLKSRRMLLLGDACNQNIFLFDEYSAPVSEYRQTLLRLKQETAGQYDRILLCHGPGDGDLTLIDGAVWLCDAILGGRDRHCPTRAFGQDVFSAKIKLPGMPIATEDIGDHSSANILYSDLTNR